MHRETHRRVTGGGLRARPLEMQNKEEEDVLGGAVILLSGGGGGHKQR